MKTYRLNNPFHYEPHPLCVDAARCVIADLERRNIPVEAGKTFGVLVHEDGVLKAYSGQIMGRSDWEGFVPAVFDYLDEDGYFKQEEARIVAIGNEISCIGHSAEMLEARKCVEEARLSADKEIAEYREFMAESKSKPMPAEEFIRMRQFQKAEFRRRKKALSEKTGQAEARLRIVEERVDVLKAERKRRSDALQRWLFEHFEMLNATGERRNLLDIFSEWAVHTGSRCTVPPGGSGECCAPKLLQYAYIHGMTPVAMAEFTIAEGEPKFVGACQSRCAPILDWMLRGLQVEPNSLEMPDLTESLDVLYEDGDIIAVDKPAGMLSVPGKSSRRSAYDILLQMRPDCERLMMVHRLDMQTSGILVAAKNIAAYRRLQHGFAHHYNINKVYYAMLEHELPLPAGTTGMIDLPLRSDYLARPRQCVDHICGKPATTRYEIVGKRGGHTLVKLHPLTGRTHQLRLHCAHGEGLGCAILGDELYGMKADRMYLHAAELEIGGLKITSAVPFLAD